MCLSLYISYLFLLFYLGYSKDVKGTEEHGEVVKATREKFLEEEFPVYMGHYTNAIV